MLKKHRYLKHICTLVAINLLTITIISCPGAPGLLPFYADDPTAKFQINPLAFPTDITRVALYIDTERYNPLNALYYVLADGTQFFDYVILGSLELRQSGTGVSIYTPPWLAGLFLRRNTHIRPLQEAGIKVLLGVRGGHDGVTFSTIPDADLPIVHQTLEAIMKANLLDGFEIWDIDGADIARDWEYDGTGFPYPSGTHRLRDGTYHTILPDEWSDWHWYGMTEQVGGQALSDFILFLRAQILGGAAADGIVGGDIEQFIILVREENYGAWIPNAPPGGTFTTIFEHLNFSVNPNPASFGSSDGWGVASYPNTLGFVEGGRRPGGSALFYYEANRRFGPLSIELNPGNSRLNSTTVVPPIVDLSLEGNCIFNFTIKFYNGRFFEAGKVEYPPESGNMIFNPAYSYSQFGIIHYRGLRSVSVAATDNAFNITDAQFDDLIDRMTQKRDYLGFDFPIDIQTISIGGQRRLTQAGYMSITSLFVFGQPVINNGGNHTKDW